MAIRYPGYDSARLLRAALTMTHPGVLLFPLILGGVVGTLGWAYGSLLLGAPFYIMGLVMAGNALREGYIIATRQRALRQRDGVWEARLPEQAPEQDGADPSSPWRPLDADELTGFRAATYAQTMPGRPISTQFPCVELIVRGQQRAVLDRFVPGAHDARDHTLQALAERWPERRLPPRDEPLDAREPRLE